MSSARANDSCVAIPRSAFSVEGIQNWMVSKTSPRRGGVEFCDDEVLVDMSQERIDSHALVEGEIYGVLDGIVKQPNAMFVNFESSRSGAVRNPLSTERHRCLADH